MIDIQSETNINLPHIHKVGIKGLRLPVQVITAPNNIQPSIATFEIATEVTSEQRATHMSRFVEILQQKSWILSVATMQELLELTTEKFATTTAYVNAKFTIFKNKLAPVSKIAGTLDYDIEFQASKRGTESKIFAIIQVLVTSLCPCSKAISKDGAHNQRAIISATVEAKPSTTIEKQNSANAASENSVYDEMENSASIDKKNQELDLNKIIEVIEQQASCELYSVLKRPDEKYITEKAYHNPKFVEDIVRDVSIKLNALPDLSCHQVYVESFESIHNHSAYAVIDRD